eukprot:CAMPEP_0197028608 /NCGR_PEP_ID=MMETSP1384-20130603/8255_1 /TAXON_ID=29189 /ORGANISM="Ammonia sp." /LENGTH=256 /DNA_ID=CAMNT_0042457631 /DNA_START=22 /DNA_END=789 /DNA_ORIENTATION=+
MANANFLVVPLYMILCAICIQAQSNHYHHEHNTPDSSSTSSSSSSSSSSTYSSTHQGDTAILGFLLIAACCFIGCCMNVCFRSSTRRRRRQRIRAIHGETNPSTVQLFAVRDESMDDFDDNEQQELSREDNKGILINLDEEMKVDRLDEAPEAAEGAGDVELGNSGNTEHRLDIVETIKREKTMCVICHDELSGNVRLLDCNHVFCDECIEQWEKEGKCLCPVCRQPTCSKKYVKKQSKRRMSPMMLSRLQSGERV